LHFMVVIDGLADLDIANPTATLRPAGVLTVTMAQPAYSIVDQDSAKSGTGTS
jgi:hypothetical protein